MNMNINTRLLLGTFFLATASFIFSSCSKNNSKPVSRSKTYKITAYGGSGITGTAQFKEILSTDSLEAIITWKGNDINNLVGLPIAIRKGTALEEGETYLELGTMKGDKGKGTLTTDIKLSFDKLLDLNAGITVSNATNGAVVAQAEIGANETFVSHDLFDGNQEANGQFRIYQRNEGSYFVIKINDINAISSACEGHDHPARVYDAGGDRDFELNRSEERRVG